MNSKIGVLGIILTIVFGVLSITGNPGQTIRDWVVIFRSEVEQFGEETRLKRIEQEQRLANIQKRRALEQQKLELIRAQKEQQLAKVKADMEIERERLKQEQYERTVEAQREQQLQAEQARVEAYNRKIEMQKEQERARSAQKWEDVVRRTVSKSIERAINK